MALRSAPTPDVAPPLVVEGTERPGRPGLRTRVGLVVVAATVPTAILGLVGAATSTAWPVIAGVVLALAAAAATARQLLVRPIGVLADHAATLVPGDADRSPGPLDLDALQRIAWATSTATDQVRRRDRTLEQVRQALADREEELNRLWDRVGEAIADQRLLAAPALHDDSIQVMTAVAYRLELMKRQLPPETHDRLDALAGDVNDAVDRLRRLLFVLTPPDLDDTGLAEALRSHVEQLGFLERGVHVSLSVPDDVDDDEVRTTLFLVIREALTNVVRHANASQVEIVVRRAAGGFHVQVVDDGVGLSTGAPARSPEGHLGIEGMRHRAERDGGWLRIESAPGQGTAVDAWLPASRDHAPT